MGNVMMLHRGGGARWNIFPQLTEPSALDGLWIKSDAVKQVHLEELAYEDGTVETLPAVLPTARYLHSGTAVGNIIYFVGGANATDVIVAFDTVTGICTTEPTVLPAPCERVPVVSYGAFLFVLGQKDNNGTIYMYDTGTKIATTKTAQVYPATHDHAGVRVGDFSYLTGGTIGASWYSRMQKYDLINDIITTCSPSPTYFVQGGICAIDTSIFFFGGTYTNLKKLIQQYDTVAQILTTKSAVFPVDTSNILTRPVGPVVYIIGNASSTIRAYDTSTGILTAVTAIWPTAISAPAGDVVGGAIYAAGGTIGGTYQTAIRRYKVSTNQFVIGTAVVNLDHGATKQALLFKTSKVLQRSRIKNILLQEANSLHVVESAVRVDGGSWTNL